MPSAFQRALEQHFEASRGHPQYQVWFDYAASTNVRGEQAVAKLEELGARPGMRLLDVGSGYGGVCIAAAKRGLSAAGIEVDSKLLSLAASNRADHPELNVEFHPHSAMDWKALASLGTFDVISCDNVVEHVPNPEVLFAHLSRLLRPGGIVYLTAPNAASFGQIISECHYGQLGLSLLDPLDGEAYVRDRLGQPSYDVSTYFTFEAYESMFRRYGLHPLYLLPNEGADAVVTRVREQRERLRAALSGATLPAPLERKVRWRIALHEETLEADLSHFERLADPHQRELFGAVLGRTYLTELWYFAASSDAARWQPPAPAPAPAPVEIGIGELVDVARRVGRRARRVARQVLQRGS